MKSVYNEVGCINANAKSFQKIHDNSGDDHDEAHDKDHDNDLSPTDKVSDFLKCNPHFW